MSAPAVVTPQQADDLWTYVGSIEDLRERLSAATVLVRKGIRGRAAMRVLSDRAFADFIKTVRPDPGFPKMEVFIVKRFRQGLLVKTYGTFPRRETAEEVAKRAGDKHKGCSVVVEPVHPAIFEERDGRLVRR